MAERVPEMIGKYKILGLVAKGGMGAVYKAVHPSLKRLVILKKLTIRNNSVVRERFKREAQILLDMQSPYIVHLYDYFVEISSHYIVEEYVEGLSLAQLLEKQVALGTEIALLIFLDACVALKFAHARGVVHRDIKPANLLISKRAEVKLADFGIASSESEREIVSNGKPNQSFSTFSSSQSDSNLTQSGTTLGTPAYMSPEQIADSGSVDNRADIYSMGVMLYESLTGTKPFPSSLSEDALKKIKKGNYINPRKIDKTIPFSICFMIKKMLKANPARRYQSIEPVIKIVKKYLSKFDAHEIRVALARTIISKKQIPSPVFVRKKNLPTKIFSACVAFAAICFLSVWLWNAGFFYKTVFSHWYSSLTLKLKMPATVSAASDLPVRAFFFEDDGNKIPEIKRSRRVFFQSDAKSDSDSESNKNYTIKSVYLHPGKYRIKIAAGPYVVWKSVNLENKNLVLEINNFENEKRALKIKTESFDSSSGKDLTSKTIFSVFYKNRWVPVHSVNSSEFKTGTVWNFKVQSSGYKELYYSLILDWYQDTLIISAALDRLE